MKASLVIAAALALTAGAASAHDSSAPAAPATVPPPPGMNDPGVQSAPASARTTPSEGLKAMREVLDKDQVKVRRADGKVIEEYSRGGQLYMVRVVPPRGVPYTYMVDPQGKLRAVSGAPPVSPVMYKILDFGKPSPPADDRQDGGGQR
jgi:hypothetical protein